MKSSSTPTHAHLSDKEITRLLLDKFDPNQLQAYYNTEKTTLDIVKNKVYGRTSETLVSYEKHSDTEDNGSDNGSDESHDTSSHGELLNKLAAIVKQKDRTVLGFRVFEATPIQDYINLAKARLGALVVSDGTNSKITLPDPNIPGDKESSQVTGTAKQVLSRIIADRLAALKNSQKTSATSESTAKSRASKISWRKRQNKTVENPEDQLPKTAVTILDWAVDIVYLELPDKHYRDKPSTGIKGQAEDLYNRVTGENFTYLDEQIGTIANKLQIPTHHNNGQLITLNHDTIKELYRAYINKYVRDCFKQKEQENKANEENHEYIDNKIDEATPLFFSNLATLETDLLTSFALTTFSSENELDENPIIKRQAANILFTFFSDALDLKVEYNDDGLLNLTSNLKTNNLNEIFTGIYHFLNDHRNSEFLNKLPRDKGQEFWAELANKYDALSKQKVSGCDWVLTAKNIEDLALILRFKTHYQTLQTQRVQEGKLPDKTLDLKAQVCEQLFNYPETYLQAQNNEETDSALTSAYNVALNTISSTDTQFSFRGSMLARSTIGSSNHFVLLLASSRSYGQIPTSTQLLDGLYRVRPSALSMYQRNLTIYFDKLKKIPTDTQLDRSGKIPVERKIKDALVEKNQPTINTAKLCAKVYFLNAVCEESKKLDSAALSVKQLTQAFKATKTFFQQQSSFYNTLFAGNESTDSTALIKNYEQLLSVGRGTIADLSSNWPTLFSGSSNAGREMAAEIKHLATFSS